jgi:hypothetical protein
MVVPALLPSAQMPMSRVWFLLMSTDSGEDEGEGSHDMHTK